MPQQMHFSIKLSVAFMYGKKQGVSISDPILEKDSNPLVSGSAPKIDMEPDVGEDRPQTIFIKVVLPAPFRPTNP